MVNVMKRRAGSDSHGNVWEHDGDVVEVDPAIAAELVAIPDGGFEVVSDDPLPAPPAPDINQPGGVSVHHPAGDEPGAGQVAEAADEGAEPAEADDPTEAEPADEADRAAGKPAGRRGRSPR